MKDNIQPKNKLIHTLSHRSPGTKSTEAMKNFDRQYPEIDLSFLSPDKLNLAGNISTQLNFLNYYVRCFESAIQLYESVSGTNATAREEFKKDPNNLEADTVLEIVDGWWGVAARDGAMSLWHFDKVLNELRQTVKLTGIANKIDEGRLTQTKIMMKRAFPDRDGLRNSIAHAGEKVANSKNQEGFKEDYNDGQIHVDQSKGTISITIIDSLANRRYSTTDYNGKVVSYMLSLESVQKLADIRDEVYDIFVPITIPTKKRNIENLNEF